MTAKSCSRIYADVLVDKVEEYWDYESTSITYGSPDKYRIIKKIGRGKYSEVFYGSNVSNNGKVVIKVLKPIRYSKIQREVHILKNVCEHENIIKMIEITNSKEGHRALIFDYVPHDRNAFDNPTLGEIKLYMFQLLKALDYCHSRGIMHRDVKPQNLIFNRDQQRLYLLDFGLAEFYHKYQEYNVRVASRHYKAPELLLNYMMYDYSLDLWATGCWLAALLFGIDPFFNGKDNLNQLVRIERVLGYAELHNYLVKYNIDLDRKISAALARRHNRRPWQEFITESNYSLCDPDIVHLVDSLLKYDHAERPTASEALQFTVFSGMS